MTHLSYSLVALPHKIIRRHIYCPSRFILPLNIYTIYNKYSFLYTGTLYTDYIRIELNFEIYVVDAERLVH